MAQSDGFPTKTEAFLSISFSLTRSFPQDNHHTSLACRRSRPRPRSLRTPVFSRRQAKDVSDPRGCEGCEGETAQEAPRTIKANVLSKCTGIRVDNGCLGQSHAVIRSASTSRLPQHIRNRRFRLKQAKASRCSITTYLLIVEHTPHPVALDY